VNFEHGLLGMGVSPSFETTPVATKEAEADVGAAVLWLVYAIGVTEEEVNGAVVMRDE